jgi:hypothetical protein
MSIAGFAATSKAPEVSGLLPRAPTRRQAARGRRI